jgi:hypothetical protein
VCNIKIKQIGNVFKFLPLEEAFSSLAYRSMVITSGHECKKVTKKKIDNILGYGVG